MSAGIASKKGVDALHWKKNKRQHKLLGVYINDLLENCHYLLGNNFVFQQTDAQAHEAKVTQLRLMAQWSLPGFQIGTLAAKSTIRVFWTLDYS